VFFFICDGNYRFKAWTAYIDKLQEDDREWHFIVVRLHMPRYKGKNAAGSERHARHYQVFPF